MKVYVFGAYRDFKCIAGECMATCCSGWKIVVDKEAYERFENMENSTLREDILSNIAENNGVCSFKNKRNGDCAMLDGDGLCRIQRNSDEKTLCNTCRKYPRLSFKREDVMLLSMAASCPVVINYLCKYYYSNIWYEMADDKKMHTIVFDEIPELSYELKKLSEFFEKIKEKYSTKNDILCELFYDFADAAVDMIIKCDDCVYVDGSLDIYESQMTENSFNKKYDKFLAEYEERLIKFEKNYSLYRLLTAIYEDNNQTLNERVYQITGEIIMNRVILFSMSQCEDNEFSRDIVQSVHWVYKAAVHGKRSAGIMHKKILEILA